jgi:hypothetical protein
MFFLLLGSSSLRRELPRGLRRGLVLQGGREGRNEEDRLRHLCLREEKEKERERERERKGKEKKKGKKKKKRKGKEKKERKERTH